LGSLKKKGKSWVLFGRGGEEKGLLMFRREKKKIASGGKGPPVLLRLVKRKRGEKKKGLFFSVCREKGEKRGREASLERTLWLGKWEKRKERGKKRKRRNNILYSACREKERSDGNKSGKNDLKEGTLQTKKKGGKDKKRGGSISFVKGKTYLLKGKGKRGTHTENVPRKRERGSAVPLFIGRRGKKEKVDQIGRGVL